MKIKTETRLILDEDFDVEVLSRLQQCRSVSSDEYDQYLVTLVRQRVHEAFKLGLGHINES